MPSLARVRELLLHFKAFFFFLNRNAETFHTFLLKPFVFSISYRGGGETFFEPAVDRALVNAKIKNA